MKSYVVCLASLVFSFSILAREPAQVTLFCNSLRFQPATGGPGQVDSFQLSSDSNLNEINGELAPLFNPGLPTHGAYFIWDDPTFEQLIGGQIAFDIPEFTDANNNGFDDFFEIGQGVSTTTTRGLFTTAVDQGSVTAVWSRAAGSTSGSCRLTLKGDMFGELPVFAHTFELLVYTGTFDYVPATNAVTGALRLAQAAHPLETLSGSLQLTRLSTNRFDQLNLASGTLSNAANLILTYPATGLQRDTISKTNYYGYVDFADGDPSTGTVDYVDWVLSVNDVNDENSNGIPDLSDDPASLPVNQPQISLSRSGRDLLLSLAAEPGATFNLQETASLNPSAWVTTRTIAVTNASQVITLPLPDSQTRYWQLKSP